MFYALMVDNGSKQIWLNLAGTERWSGGTDHELGRCLITAPWLSTNGCTVQPDPRIGQR